MPATLLREPSVAVHASNSPTVKLTIPSLNLDDEAKLWPPPQSQMLPLLLTPGLTVDHRPLGVGLG